MSSQNRQLIGTLVVGFAIALIFLIPRVDWTTLDWEKTATFAALIAQAASAVAIVLVTIQLSRTASQALETSEKQVAATEIAVRLQRRDQQIAFAPIVEMERPIIQGPPHTLAVATLTNTSDTPALAVSISLAAANDEWVQMENEVRTAYPTIPPHSPVNAEIGMASFRNIPTPEHPNRPREARFTSAKILVFLRYKGVLGQTVLYRYRWSANYEPQEDAGVWRPVMLTIEPDVPDSEPAMIPLD